MNNIKRNYRIKSLKKERDNFICTLYDENRGIMEISRILSISKTTVTKVLKKYNKYNLEKQKNRLTKEKIIRNEKAIKLYNNGLSFRKIAEILKIGHTTVEQIIHNFIEKRPVQYNINIDSKNDFIRHRKYNYDFNFFELVDTEEKAYWLGFLYADGCITETAVKLELQINDFHHLEKLKNSLNGYDIELRKRADKYAKSCILLLHSKKMVNDLTKLGCIRRKTFTLSFPSL